jgi:hypothetical protein
MAGLCFDIFENVYYGPDGVATRMFAWYQRTGQYHDSGLPWATHGSLDAYNAILTMVRPPL